MTELTSAPETVPPSRALRSRARTRAARWWRRRPVRKAWLLSHRWLGLILGLFLVVECTTGAVLLYHAEYFRATNSELYRHTPSNAPMSGVDAIRVVDRAHPAFGASWVATDGGVWVVGEPSYAKQWFVDPGSGHLNGLAHTDRGVMALLVNIHDCGFTCAGYPGYSSWFATPIWDDGPTAFTGITRGGFVLGVLGLLAVFLVLSSVRIWWPGRKKLRSRLVVRRGRGRFARDFDLHNVVGAIGLPFLLMWGITGAALEFPVVEKAWLAVTGGDQPAVANYSVTPNPAAAQNPQITATQAVAAAIDEAGGGRMQFLVLPTKATPYYEVDLITSFGSDRFRAIYGGDAYAYVDAHDASNVNVVNGADEGPGPNRFYDKFLEPTHFGWNVNAWWRIVWFVLGIAPLVLFVTGVSTWLFRRGVKKRRRRAGLP